MCLLSSAALPPHSYVYICYGFGYWSRSYAYTYMYTINSIITYILVILYYYYSILYYYYNILYLTRIHRSACSFLFTHNVCVFTLITITHTLRVYMLYHRVIY